MLLLGYLLNPLLSIWLSSHTLSNALKWSDLESSNLLFTTQPFPVGSHTLATSQRLPRLCSTTQLPFSWQARLILALWAVGDPKDSLPRAWYELLGQQGTAPQGGAVDWNALCFLQDPVFLLIDNGKGACTELAVPDCGILLEGPETGLNLGGIFNWSDISTIHSISELSWLVIKSDRLETGRMAHWPKHNPLLI